MPCPSGWGFYILIMKKIELLTSSTSLGRKGDIIEVGINLAIGLIGRKQAIWNKSGKAKTSLETKTVKELQEIAKEKGFAYSGLKKADLIKELKEADTTKEDKSEYKTK